MSEETGWTFGKEDRESGRAKVRRPGRMLMLFKALVALALLGVTAYGMINDGLYSDDLWLPVAVGILALLLVTVFVRGYYVDVPTAGWALFALLVALAAVKGVSITWTLSEAETIKEFLRCSMYVAAFLLVLGALNSGRQVAPLMDVAVLIVVAVAGYGLMQKISPVQYPVTSLDKVRIDSTLDYVNTLAMVLGMGVVLALARMARLRNAVLRGLYAVFVLAFLVALLLTVSRGGIASLGVGLMALFILTSDRLQIFANLALVSIPGAWLFWEMKDLKGLWSLVPNEQKIADGTAFRDYLIIALVVAFVLQAGYSLVFSRYELLPLGRRTLGALALGGVVLVGLAAAFVVVSQYGGVEKTYQALVNNPVNTKNASQRLASASIGFRADYWKVAWDEWKAHPLTGSGAGTFQYVWLKNRPITTGVKQVHNLYLEQGTETGIFAFLALVSFVALLLGYIARAAWRSGARGDRRVLLSGLVAAAVIYLVSSVIEWHWYIPPSTLFFFILAAIAVKLAAEKDWETSEEIIAEGGRGPAVGKQ